MWYKISKEGRLKSSIGGVIFIFHYKRIWSKYDKMFVFANSRWWLQWCWPMLFLGSLDLLSKFRRKRREGGGLQYFGVQDLWLVGGVTDERFLRPQDRPHLYLNSNPDLSAIVPKTHSKSLSPLTHGDLCLSHQNSPSSVSDSLATCPQCLAVIPVPVALLMRTKPRTWQHLAGASRDHPYVNSFIS